MKTFSNKYLIVLSLFLCSMITACSESKDEFQEQSIIDLTPISIDTKSGESVFKFNASADWKATVSSTSWIELDASTKVGSKGDAEIKYRWKQNEGVEIRSAHLTITVKNEESRQVKITQLSSEPTIHPQSSDLQFIIDPLAASGKGIFTASVEINSNVKWTIKDLPEWIAYRIEDDKEPVEGITTQVKLVLHAKPELFSAQSMEDKIIIGRPENSNTDIEINVKASSEIFIKDTQNNEIQELLMERSVVANNQFVGQFYVEGNTDWTIKKESLPEWIILSAYDNIAEYENVLQTKKQLRVFIKENLIDTDKLVAEVILENKRLNLQKAVSIIFPGTGLDYYESVFSIPQDFIFSASQFDQNGNYIPTAIMTMDFSVRSGKDYTSLFDAPFKYIFIGAKNGMPVAQEIYWANVDYNGKTEVAPLSSLISHDFTLWVQSRFSYMEDATSIREAFMLIVDQDVTFDDLFEPGSSILKEEYDKNMLYITQAGISEGDFECSIQDNYVSCAKDKNELYFEIYSTPSNIYTDYDPNSWVLVDFIVEGGSPSGLKVTTQPNDTGSPRSKEIIIYQFVSDEVPEKEVYRFMVEQAG